MPTFSAGSSKKPEFSYKEKEQLETLRQYAAGLKELQDRISREFPGSREVSDINSALSSTISKIVKLELMQLEANLKGELPK